MVQAIPEKLINFKAYNEANDLVGVSDIELPSMEYLTETMKGAGIAGEVDSPTLGHFSSMETKMTWRTLEKNLFSLAGGKGLKLDFRGAQQVYNPAKGEHKVVPVKVIVAGMPKSTELGKFEPGAVVGATTTLETTYLKIVVDGRTQVEIDKYNYIANVGGIDYLAEVRKALGV